MPKVIKINNLSKVYDLGLVGTGTLSKDLNRTWAKLMGKPDPYATLVELNDRTKKSSSNMVYALKEISFNVEQGEVLGIIGKNGAGKSTLLKILSQITSPSTGSIKMKGRVASLLEVGTGMHPEMTARQNIYLNGSLMGMRRKEISLKLDEITHFAGIEKYIDTPIKRFSSGMTVRLGFAIAAFLEPEILIVDEVLAVGDAEFQKKAIGKMQDVSNSEGRTVLFVSHNLGTVSELCKRSILLNNGQVFKDGNSNEVISEYLSNFQNNSHSLTLNGIIENIELTTKKAHDIFSFGNEIVLNIQIKYEESIKGASIGVAFLNNWKHKLFTTFTDILEKKQVYTLIIPSKTFLKGNYSFDVAIFYKNSTVLEYHNDICMFELVDFESKFSKFNASDVGFINLECKWE